MTKGLDQQNPSMNVRLSRSTPAAQHGQKPDRAATEVRETRSLQPRPAH
jgi:hypothetical protein